MSIFSGEHGGLQAGFLDSQNAPNAMPGEPMPSTDENELYWLKHVEESDLIRDAIAKQRLQDNLPALPKSD